MTTDEHAHVQHLEGLVKRFRSRIAAIDMENKSLEARASEAERRLAEAEKCIDVAVEQRDIIAAKCDEAERRLREIRLSDGERSTLEYLAECREIESLNSDDPLFRGNASAEAQTLKRMLALLDTGAGQGEKT